MLTRRAPAGLETGTHCNELERTGRLSAPRPRPQAAADLSDRAAGSGTSRRHDCQSNVLCGETLDRLTILRRHNLPARPRSGMRLVLPLRCETTRHDHREPPTPDIVTDILTCSPLDLCSWESRTKGGVDELHALHGDRSAPAGWRCRAPALRSCLWPRPARDPIVPPPSLGRPLDDAPRPGAQLPRQGIRLSLGAPVRRSARQSVAVQGSAARRDCGETSAPAGRARSGAASSPPARVVTD